TISKRDWSSDVCSSDLITLQAGEPALRRVSPVMREISRDQRDVVLVERRPHAQSAAPFGIGELFIADRGEGIVLACEHHSRTDRSEESRVGKEWRCRVF